MPTVLVRPKVSIDRIFYTDKDGLLTDVFIWDVEIELFLNWYDLSMEYQISMISSITKDIWNKFHSIAITVQFGKFK